MILNEFLLLFKSDASQASKDISELDKKIDGLTEKGKKRSEQENKDLKETIKQRKELNDGLKETDAQYMRITENILAATTAAFSLGSIIKGTFGAAETNSALAVQGKILGQSAQDLKAYGYAFQAAGGDADSFRQQIQKTSDNIFQISGHIPKVEEVIKKLREATRIGREEAARTGDTSRFNREAELAGILPGARPFFLLSDEDAAKAVKRFQDITSNTEDGAKVAREFADSFVTLSASIDKVFTALDIKLLPALTKLSNETSGLIADPEHFKEAIDGITTGVEALAVVIGGVLVRALAAATLEAAPLIAAFAAFDLYKNGKEGLTGGAINKGLSHFADKFGLKPEDFFDQPVDKSKAKQASVRIATESVFESPAIAENRKRANGGIDPYADYMHAGQRTLAIAENSRFGTGIINNAGAQNNRTINVKIGDVNVHTNSNDVTGVSSGIANELRLQIRAAVSNWDDGVAR